jgi:cytochrome c oxidase subunit 2
MFGTFRLHPEEASTLAGRVDAIYFFALVVSIIAAIAVTLTIFYLAYRYRRRNDTDVGVAVHGATMLEIGWSVIPFVVMLVCFAWGAKVFFAASRPPEQAVEYFVVGKQWMWKFQHPDGHREINDLHVPLGVPIKFTMTSEDVIHSLFFPAFRVKADVLPGRYTTLWFQATKPGTYHIFCAEYCGTEHSKMIGRVMVMEPSAYQEWLAGSGGVQPAAVRGEELFTTFACVSCHRTDSRARGPILAGLYGRRVQLAHGGTVVADEGYLRESILNPTAKVVAGYQPVMPTFQGQIGEDDLLQLIAYIKTLKPADGVP